MKLRLIEIPAFFMCAKCEVCCQIIRAEVQGGPQPSDLDALTLRCPKCGEQMLMRDALKRKKRNG